METTEMSFPRWTDEWMMKMWCIYTMESQQIERVINTWYTDMMEHHSFMKKDAPTKFSGKQLGLEKMKLSEWDDPDPERQTPHCLPASVAPHSKYGDMSIQHGVTVETGEVEAVVGNGGGTGESEYRLEVGKKIKPRGAPTAEEEGHMTPRGSDKPQGVILLYIHLRLYLT